MQQKDSSESSITNVGGKSLFWVLLYTTCNSFSFCTIVWPEWSDRTVGKQSNDWAYLSQLNCFHPIRYGGYNLLNCLVIHRRSKTLSVKRRKLPLMSSEPRAVNPSLSPPPPFHCIITGGQQQMDLNFLSSCLHKDLITDFRPFLVIL